MIEVVSVLAVSNWDKAYVIFTGLLLLAALLGLAVERRWRSGEAERQRRRRQNDHAIETLVKLSELVAADMVGSRARIQTLLLLLEDTEATILKAAVFRTPETPAAREKLRTQLGVATVEAATGDSARYTLEKIQKEIAHDIRARLDA